MENLKLELLELHRAYIWLAIDEVTYLRNVARIKHELAYIGGAS